jgi:glutathione S-transferase
MIAAHELGLEKRLTLLRTVVAMAKPNEALLSDNPIGKIPTLLLDDGMAIYDSLTICEYFDELAGGGRLFPAARPERWNALTRHALANGLLDVLILWRNERDKPQARQTPEWIAAFALKTRATLERFEQLAPGFGDAPFDIGHVAIGCALSYLDFRFADLDWRAGRPSLTTWYQSFCERPSAKATEIVDG